MSEYYRPNQLHRAGPAIYPRTKCAIAGCKRTSAMFPDEWMCADHWRLLTSAERRALRRVWRLIHKVGRPADRVWAPKLGHLRLREYTMWRAAKRRVSKFVGAAS